MAENKYKLVNVEGIGRLKTRHGDFNIGEETDEILKKLHEDGSHYVALADDKSAEKSKEKKSEDKPV